MTGKPVKVIATFPFARRGVAPGPGPVPLFAGPLDAGVDCHAWCVDHPGDVAHLRVDRDGGSGPLTVTLTINGTLQPHARIMLPGSGFRVAILPVGTAPFRVGDCLGCVVDAAAADGPGTELLATAVVRMRVAIPAATRREGR